MQQVRNLKETSIAKMTEAFLQKTSHTGVKVTYLECLHFKAGNAFQ